MLEVKPRQFLDFLVVAVTCVMHLVVGFSISGLGRAYVDWFRELGSDLPPLTTLLVSYCSSRAPIVAGLILAGGAACTLVKGPSG